MEGIGKSEVLDKNFLDGYGTLDISSHLSSTINFLRQNYIHIAMWTRVYLPDLIFTVFTYPIVKFLLRFVN